MAITLTPEQEQVLRQDAETLAYESAEAYLAEKLQSMHELNLYLSEHREEFSRMIDEGWEEAERGEVLTAEEAKAQIAAMKQDFLTKRSAA